MLKYLFESADRMCKREIKPSRLHEHTKTKKNNKRSLNESVSRRGKRSLKEAFVDYDPIVVLFDTMDRIEIGRNGDFEGAEFISYDELMNDWASPNDNFSEEDYQDAIDEITSMLKGVKLYSDDGAVYLQLSDNHTLWDINFTDEMDIEYSYPEFVNGAADKFWSETGKDLFYLGRSGRHVCVGYTWDNLVNYDYLQGVQQRLEKEIVDYFNGEYERIKSAKTNESLKSRNRRKHTKDVSEDYYRDSYDEEDNPYKKEPRYTLAYKGYIFDGDNMNDWNYHDYDDWDEVVSVYNTYKKDDMDMYIDHNEYGVTFHNGEWY